MKLVHSQTTMFCVVGTPPNFLDMLAVWDANLHPDGIQGVIAEAETAGWTNVRTAIQERVQT